MEKEDIKVHELKLRDEKKRMKYLYIDSLL